MSKNIKFTPWPPFKRSGTTITQRTASDNLDLLLGNAHLSDDTAIRLGNTLAAPNAQLLWETKDANANILLLALPAGGATDVPVLAIGDDTALDKDLGFFNGLVYPFLAMLSPDATKYGGFGHDGTNFVLGSSSGGTRSISLLTMGSLGTATAVNPEYNSNDFTWEGSAWDTDDLVARKVAFRSYLDATASTIGSATWRMYFDRDDVVQVNVMTMNQAGTVTFAGNINTLTGVVSATPTDVGLTLRGNKSDGATAVGTIMDNTSTLSTAGAKLLSVQNNTAEKAYISYLGGFANSVTEAVADAFSSYFQHTNTSTTGVTSYGVRNTLSSSAVVTGTNQNLYGNYNVVTKTGADTSVDTTALYGVYGSASNTGSTDAGTKVTYGGYFQATGDTAGTSTAYGIYATVAGADTNWAGWFNGNVNIVGTLSGNKETLVPSSGAVDAEVTDSGKTYYNTAASTVTLPAVADGVKYKFIVQNASYFQISADGAEKVRYKAQETAGGGYFRSQTVGDCVELIGINGEWYIHSLEGTWTIDS